MNSVTQWSRKRVKSEFWNITKFAIVGLTSLGINVLIYALLSRWVWINGDRTIEAIIAVLVSSIYNFRLHYLWTFRAIHFDIPMLIRYGIVLLIGTGVYGGLFYLGHVGLGFYDYAVVIFSACVTALLTYLLHRWYTFRYQYKETTEITTEEVFVSAQHEE